MPRINAICKRCKKNLFKTKGIYITIRNRLNQNQSHFFLCNKCLEVLDG